jgi:hypothetical protein
MVMDKTNVKNDAAKQLKKAIILVRNMAEIAFNGKGKYNSFGFENLSRLTDMELCRMCGRVVRLGNKLFAPLAQQGLTKAMLDNVTTLASQFLEAINEMDKAAEDRELEAQNRVEKGNLLWKETSILASIGKNLFEDTNEAKYNDYVLIG